MPVDAPLGTAALKRPDTEARNRCLGVNTEETKRHWYILGLIRGSDWTLKLINVYTMPISGGNVQPLLVCRSTSTVGFPLESRISLATIFSIDILKNTTKFTLHQHFIRHFSVSSSQQFPGHGWVT